MRTEAAATGVAEPSHPTAPSNSGTRRRAGRASPVPRYAESNLPAGWLRSSRSGRRRGGVGRVVERAVIAAPVPDSPGNSEPADGADAAQRGGAITFTDTVAASPMKVESSSETPRRPGPTARARPSPNSPPGAASPKTISTASANSECANHHQVARRGPTGPGACGIDGRVFRRYRRSIGCARTRALTITSVADARHGRPGPARAPARALRPGAGGDRRRRARPVSARRPAALLEIGAGAASSAAGCRRRCARAIFTASRRRRRAGASRARGERGRRARRAEALPCGGRVRRRHRPVRVRRRRRRRRGGRGDRRVLAPGGRFVHLLDMATLLERPFAKLATRGWCRSRTCSAIRAITNGRWTSCCWNATGWRTCCASPRRRPSVRGGVRAGFAPFLAAPFDVARRDGRVQGDRRQRRTPADAGGGCSRPRAASRSPRATRPSSRCPFIPAATCRACSRRIHRRRLRIELSEIVARASAAPPPRRAGRPLPQPLRRPRAPRERAAPPPARAPRAARPATSSSRRACSPPFVARRR